VWRAASLGEASCDTLAQAGPRLADQLGVDITTSSSREGTRVLDRTAPSEPTVVVAERAVTLHTLVVRLDGGPVLGERDADPKSTKALTADTFRAWSGPCCP
jgi:hypothetical protein